MTELEVTWEKALVVWWALTWRTLVFILPTAFIIGGIIGFIMSALNIPVRSNAIYLNIVGMVLGTVMSIWIIKIILSKTYSSFRIALIKVHSKET